MIVKRPSESRTVTSRIIRQNDVNSLGTAHGGFILEWMDTAASICARRHSNRRVNTVAVEELTFLRPLHVGYVAKIEASICRTFTSSMQVIVNVYEENTLQNSLIKAVTGIFIFVGLDENDKPAVVPELVPESDREKELWEQAGQRRNLMQQRKSQN